MEEHWSSLQVQSWEQQVVGASTVGQHRSEGEAKGGFPRSGNGGFPAENPGFSPVGENCSFRQKPQFLAKTRGGGGGPPPNRVL